MKIEDNRISLTSTISDNVKALQKHPYFRTIKNSAILLIYFFIGSLFYHLYEGWDYGASLGFTIVTISTVGYGYQTPSDDYSRVFTIFYIFLGVYFVYASIKDLFEENLDYAKGYFESKKGKKLILTVSFYRKRFYVNLFLIFLTLIVGAICVISLEGWSFIKSFYFAVQTSTTVGYGELAISNKQTRFFIPFYIILSTILLAHSIKRLQEMRSGLSQIQKYENMQRLNQNLLKLLDCDKGDGITKAEFILEILKHVGVLNYDKDIAHLAEKFDAIDLRGDGKLQQDELLKFCSVESQRAQEELDDMESQKKISFSSFIDFFCTSPNTVINEEDESSRKEETEDFNNVLSKQRGNECNRNAIITSIDEKYDETEENSINSKV